MLCNLAFLCSVFYFSALDFFILNRASGTFSGNAIENVCSNLPSHVEFSSVRTFLARSFSSFWLEPAVSGSCTIGNGGRNMGFPGKDSCKSWYLR